MPGCEPCDKLRELLATMHTLRSPGGCPWDAEQTPESLAPYILEEACEAIEAIEAGSAAMIADELGDLLLQIVFQAEIFAERGQFDFADIAAGINAKLLRRHPHVFADVPANTGRAELAAQWERIKNEESSSSTATGSHPRGRLPKHLPALQLAQKLVSRVNRTGPETERWLPEPVPGERLSEAELSRELLRLVQRAAASDLDAEQVLRRAVRMALAEVGDGPSSAAAG